MYIYRLRKFQMISMHLLNNMELPWNPPPPQKKEEEEEEEEAEEEEEEEGPTIDIRKTYLDRPIAVQALVIPPC